MKYNIICLIFGVTLLFILGCEEIIEPDLSDDPEDIVVEGYIEGGEIPLPPIVMLTRSFPFTGVNGQGFSNLFIHDAVVSVNDGNQNIILKEFCWDDLDAEQKQTVLEAFNLEFDSLTINVCVYTDPDLVMVGEIGKTYSLKVEAEGKVLTSITTIPLHVPIDTLWFQQNPGNVDPIYKELRAIISDPASEENYYRYFTSNNRQRFFPGFNSVADDAFFDGQEFEFPLPKGESSRDTLYFETFGLYMEGDSVILRWTNIDKPHFDFWSTLEFNGVNQGPFSSYTRIETNIEGGLGIWGGYSNSYYALIVKE